MVNYINSIFKENQALGAQGIGGSYQTFASPYMLLTTKNCTFFRNCAQSAGAFSGGNAAVIDDGSLFIENSAKISAGAILLDYEGITNLNNTIFKGNYVGSNGGVLSIPDRGIVSMNNVTFYNNSAQVGGALSIINLPQMIITNSFFINNQAYDGAAIYLSNRAQPLEIINTKFKGNSGQLFIFRIVDGIANINSIQAVDNFNTFLAVSSAKLTIQNGIIQNSKCGLGVQGCIISMLESSVVKFTNFSAINITTHDTSSNIYIKTSNLSIHNSNFSQCSSQGDSSIIFGQDSSISIILTNFMKFEKTAIYVVNTYFQMNSSNFGEQNLITYINTSSRGGVIYCQDCLNAIIKNSRFSNIFISQGQGAGIFITSLNQQNSLIVLRNNVFENLCALQGSVIYLNNENIVLLNNIFNKNQAKSCTGLQLKCQINKCKWNTTLNHFLNNKAELQGEGYCWEKYQPFNDETNIFDKNTAKYGSDRSSFPAKIQLEEIVGDNNIFDNIQSGAKLPTQIKFSIRDTYDQVMTTLDEGEASVSVVGFNLQLTNTTVQKSYSILGETIVPLNKGYFLFDSIFPRGYPSTKGSLQFTSQLIDSSNSNTTYAQDNLIRPPTYNLSQQNISFRSCQSGEIFDKEQSTCESCPVGKYSFYPYEDTSCHECPQNAECPGTNQILVKVGFWRSSNVSIDVYECNPLGESCLGGINSSCELGYDGPLCSVCQINETDVYFKSGTTTCVNCKEGGNAVAIVTAFVFVYCIYLILVIRLNVKEAVESAEADDQQRQEASRNIALMKIIASYAQVTAMIGNVSIKWPTQVLSFQSVQSSLGNIGTIFYPLDCVFNSVQIDMSLYYKKQVTSTIFFIFIIMLITCFWKIIGLLRKQSQSNYIIISIIVLCYNFQPQYLNMLLNTFLCTNIDQTSRLNDYLLLTCYKDEHALLTIIHTIPLLIFWLFILPLSLFLYIKKHKNNIMSQEIRSKVGFVLEGYAQKYYYWEFVIMIRKYCIILASIFINEVSSLILSLLLLILVFIYIQIKNKPYFSEEFNKLEIISHTSNFLTFLACIYYIYTNNSVIQLILMLFILIANCIFIFSWGKQFAYALKQKIQSISFIKKFSKSSIFKDQNKSQENQSYFQKIQTENQPFQVEPDTQYLNIKINI